MHNEHKCGRCGSARTSIIAQSVSPPGEFVQCQDCGHSTLMASMASRAAATAKTASTPSPTDVDKRRIERLVTTVLEARRLPCQLLAVDKMTAGWRVSVRTQVGDFMKFDVPDDSLAAMRGAIERKLATEMS